MENIINSKGAGRPSEPLETNTTNCSREFTALIGGYQLQKLADRLNRLWQSSLRLFCPGIAAYEGDLPPHHSYIVGAIAACVLRDLHVNLFPANGFPKIATSPREDGDLAVVFELHGVTLQFALPRAEVLRAADWFKRTGRHHRAIFDAVQAEVAKLEHMISNAARLACLPTM